MNKIICDDVLDGLKQIPDDSVHLIFTSPPYNVKIDYGNRDDDEPYSVYIDWLKDIMEECHRVLVDGGRLVINIDAMTNRQEDADEEYVRPIYADLVNAGREIGLKFRTEICWYKQNAVGKKTAWGSYCSCSNPIMRRNHEYILVWSKGDWKLEGDSELSDMTKEEFHEYTLSTWFIQPETRNLNNHPVPFPEELAKRVIKLFSYRENTVLDPFAGTGTTVVVAHRLCRNYIGIDNDSNHCEYALDRLAATYVDDDYEPRSERMAREKAMAEKTKAKKVQTADVFDDD